MLWLHNNIIFFPPNQSCVKYVLVLKHIQSANKSYFSHTLQCAYKRYAIVTHSHPSVQPRSEQHRTLYFTPFMKAPVRDTDLTDPGCFTKTASSRDGGVQDQAPQLHTT